MRWPAPELDPRVVGVTSGQGLAGVGSLRPLENAEAQIYLKRLEMSVVQVTQKPAGGGVMDWRRSLTAQTPVGDSRISQTVGNVCRESDTEAEGKVTRRKVPKYAGERSCQRVRTGRRY